MSTDHGTTCMVSPTVFEVDRLFVLGTQMAVGGTLVGVAADGAAMTPHFDSPWAVIGLAQWMQTSFYGKPGRMRPRQPQLMRDAVARLRQERPKIRRLLMLKYAQFFDSTSRTDERWDASWALVHFLLDPKQKPDLSQRFHRYLRSSVQAGVGASSSEFDKVMGTRIEDVSKALYAWLDSL